MKIRITSIAACVLLSACGGGGSSGGEIVAPSPPPPPDPPSRQAVYSAQEDTAGQWELYLVDFANPGESTKLSGTLVADGDVGNIAVTADAEQVVYRADQDTVDISELYLVDIANPGVSTKLSDTLVANGTVLGFQLTADGGHVVYRADQDVDDVFELYLAALSDPGVSVKLSDFIVPGGDVSTFLLSPDGTQAMYRADQDAEGTSELYLVDLATPGASTKLSEDMVALGNVSTVFAFSPDGTKVAYRADQDTNGVNELYLVDIATPGVSQTLSSTLVANGDVEDFTFSPDGTQALYHADQDTDEVFELYLVDIATPGVSTKVNDTLVAGGNAPDLFTFAFNSDGTQVLYRADQDTDEVTELYLVDTTMPGTSMKVNETLAVGGEVGFHFAFTPDDAQIVYLAEQDIDDLRELYLVDTATPGASIKLNAPLVAGGTIGVAAIWFVPDAQLVYGADQDTDEVFELYLMDIAAPAVTTRLNGPIVAGGLGVGNFILL